MLPCATRNHQNSVVRANRTGERKECGGDVPKVGVWYMYVKMPEGICIMCSKLAGIHSKVLQSSVVQNRLGDGEGRLPSSGEPSAGMLAQNLGYCDDDGGD